MTDGSENKNSSKQRISKALTGLFIYTHFFIKDLLLI
ncbi:hypothetical protein ES705_19245 [subsurface metagenome]